MKKMNINIFDLSNYKVPYFYERKLSSFTYDIEEWKKSMNNFGEKYNFPTEEIPWGEKRDSEKLKIFKSKSTQFFSQEELGSVPMHLRYNYFAESTIPSTSIEYCWIKFIEEINNVRKKSRLLGEHNCFDTYFSFSHSEFNSKFIPQIPETGFVKTPLFNIRNIFQNFQKNIKPPILMDSVVEKSVSLPKDTSFFLLPSVSFCEVLINYKYFFNSPVDVIFGGQGVTEHNIGDVNVPTIEKLGEHLIDKCDLDINMSVINVFIDRCDLLSWRSGTTTFDDKSYYVRDVIIFEKKDNYYEDLLQQLVTSKKIYNTIISYKPDQKELDLEDCQILLDQIIEIE
jgi:hypothetical protein